MLRAFVKFAAVPRVEISEPAAPASKAAEKARLLMGMVSLPSVAGLVERFSLRGAAVPPDADVVSSFTASYARKSPDRRIGAEQDWRAIAEALAGLRPNWDYRLEIRSGSRGELKTG
jgi:hypothetical protein